MKGCGKMRNRVYSHLVVLVLALAPRGVEDLEARAAVASGAVPARLLGRRARAHDAHGAAGREADPAVHASLTPSVHLLVAAVAVALVALGPRALESLAHLLHLRRRQLHVVAHAAQGAAVARGVQARPADLAGPVVAGIAAHAARFGPTSAAAESAAVEHVV